MKYFPFETLTFRSGLTEEQIRGKLATIMLKKYPFGFTFIRKADYSNYYIGKLRESGFKITIRNASNAFTPVVIGVFSHDGAGTVIKVRMRLHSAIYAFLAIWAGPLIVLFFIMIFVSISRKQFGVIVFFPVGVVLFFYFVIMKGFKSVSKEAVRTLEKVFETEAIQN